MTERKQLLFCWSAEAWTKLTAILMIAVGVGGVVYSQILFSYLNEVTPKSAFHNEAVAVTDPERRHSITSFAWAWLAASIVQLFLGVVALEGSVKEDATSLAAYLIACPLVLTLATTVFFIHVSKGELSATEITGGCSVLALQIFSLHVVNSNMLNIAHRALKK